jgi:hypothetical protein
MVKRGLFTQTLLPTPISAGLHALTRSLCAQQLCAPICSCPYQLEVITSHQWPTLAVCTWPSEAAAMGTGSNSSYSCPMGAPSPLSTIAMAEAESKAGTLSCGQAGRCQWSFSSNCRWAMDHFKVTPLNSKQNYSIIVRRQWWDRHGGQEPGRAWKARE